MKNKKCLFIVLAIIWLLIIFIFSNQNATKSLSISDNFTYKIINLYEKGFQKNVDNKEKVVKKLRFIVRKTAHFTVYLILGIIIYKICLLDNKKNILIPLLICLCFASFDEIHQHFILNRTPKVLDVFIDTIGSLTGISLIYLKNKKGKEKKYHV